MRLVTVTVLAAAAFANAASLSSMCTSDHVTDTLPADGFIPGIVLDPSSITANAIYNATITSSNDYPAANRLDFCNVTFAYTHDGLGDRVLVNYWLPAPSDFKNRYLSTGGYVKTPSRVCFDGFSKVLLYLICLPSCILQITDFWQRWPANQ